MTVFAITLVKDECDLIETTVRRTAAEVDHQLILDNASSDGTRDILADLARELPITIEDDPEIGYFQSAKTSRLAAKAAEMGADFVIPRDTDEVWYSPFGRVANILSEHPGAVATAEIYDHVATAVDSDEPDPIKRIGWRRREPCPLHKVACRPILPVTITQGNHGASYPTQQSLEDQIVIRHFPHRDVRQLVKKVRNGAAAYAATDLPFDQGRHWREWGKLLDERGEEAIGELFRTWYWSAYPESDPELIFDPCPSQ